MIQKRCHNDTKTVILRSVNIIEKNFFHKSNVNKYSIVLLANKHS